MPTFTTANFDAQSESRVNLARLAAANVASGTVEFLVVLYTLLGTEVAGDVIKLGLLPTGAIPVPQLSSVTPSVIPVLDVTVDEVTTTGVLTLDLGTAADPDGWADGIDLAAGGKVLATSGTIPAWLAATPIVADSGSGNAIAYATVATQAGAVQAAAKLHFVLAYKRGR